VLALGAGCAPGDEASAKKPASTASPSGASSSAVPSTPADPFRTPAELLREAVEVAKVPSSMRVHGKVALPDAALVEGELYLRNPGLPTRPGRPWLHLPGGEFPSRVLDEWATLSDITDPAQYLGQLADHGTALSRKRVRYGSTRHLLVRGRLTGSDLPAGICIGSRSTARVRPTSVRLSVWLDTAFDVSRLELACRYPHLPTVTFTGCYTEIDDLALEFDPPRADRVTEVGGTGETEAA
jgi:hypothetical protein